MVIGGLIFLFACGFTVTGSFTFWPVTQALDFYKPIVMFLGFYLLGIVVAWIVIDIIGRLYNPHHHEDNTPRFARRLLVDGMRYIDNLALARVKKLNADRLPTNERFLYVCNHTSNFDPMITCAYYPKHNIAFITKGGNFKIPLGGRLMKSTHYQAIDRQDPLQSLAVMKKSADLIENDICSVGVYPEGTRHPDGVLGNFHEGVFSIAVKAKCPIVVGTIVNSQNIHKNFPKKFTRTILDIPCVLRYEDYEGKTAKAISDEVKAIMEDNIKANYEIYFAK